MNVLSLQQWVIAFRWVYNGNSIKKQISKQEAARDNLNGALIRIGRDKLSCNLYLEDGSVSGQHAEIYFKEQQQKFFIKSLSPRNTTKVDGQDLVYSEELPLKNNSAIVLGRQQVEITNIQVFELQSTDYSGIVNSSSNSIPVNSSPVNSSSHSSQVNPSNSGTNDKSKSWQDKAIVGAIATVLAAGVTALSAWYVTERTQETTKDTKRIEMEATKEVEQSKLAATIAVEEKKLRSEKEKIYLDRFIKHREKVAKIRKGNRDRNKLMLRNNCSRTVSVAASFYSLADVIQSQGWLNIKPGGEVPPGYITNSSSINLYAISTNSDGKKIAWKGNEGYVNRFITKDDFNYIEEPFLDPNIEKESVEFYTVKFSPQSGGYTTKTFTCKGGKLELN